MTKILLMKNLIGICKYLLYHFLHPKRNSPLGYGYFILLVIYTHHVYIKRHHSTYHETILSPYYGNLMCCHVVSHPWPMWHPHSFV